MIRFLALPLLFAASAFAADNTVPGNPSATAPAKMSPSGWVAAAQGTMKEGAWDVTGTISGTNTWNVSGRISGADFDLSTTPTDGGVTTREVGIDGKYWRSVDGGKTWESTRTIDLLIYNLVRFPFTASFDASEFLNAGREDQRREKWQHIRVGSSNGMPHYWIGVDAEAKPGAIRRFHGAVLTSKGTANLKLDFSPAKEKTIAKPVTKPAR